MPAPDGFTWIEKPLLGAMARPGSADEYRWLRDQGIQLVVVLTEDPPPRSWINDAGLFSVHIPVEDMAPPSQKQIDHFLATVQKAHAQNVGVGVHCSAGLGRTGTMLACYFVSKGLAPKDAISRVRRVRPGSVETQEQSEAITEYARRRKMQEEFQGP